MDSNSEPEPQVMERKSKKGLTFWSVILCINICFFTASLEMTCVATALPTIINALQGGSMFIWVGSAYTIATTAFMPIMGGMAQVFGRRIALLSSIALFVLGSALCGAASSMNMLVAGRAIQGCGGSGLLNISTIILSDLVPLVERGTYNGILQVTFGIASGIGPLIGGALAQNGQWRWIFYLNLPFAGVAAVLVLLFVNLKVPEGTMVEKLRRIDWIGTFIIVSSTVSFAIGLTWGGVLYAWSSARVLVPLILGVVGILAFFVFEALWAKNAIVPYHLLSNRTTMSGYIQNASVVLPFTALTYYLPVYFQGARGYSPIRSGVILLGLAFSLPPFTIFSGVSVTILKQYRSQLWVGWCITVAALALFATVTVGTSVSTIVGFEILAGVGGGIIFSTTYFPVLAPIPISSMSYALSFFGFGRQFAQIWAVVIGGAILQNQLENRIASLVSGIAIEQGDVSYQFIPLVKTLPQPLQGEVQAAFADSTQMIWKVLAGLSVIGLLASLVMRHVPLHAKTDKNWGISENEKKRNESNDGINLVTTNRVAESEL